MTSSPIPVTDILSNFNDQLGAAARLIGRSKDRQAVFKAIYYGKKQTKTIGDISQKTRLSKIRVLQEGGKMAGILIDKVTNGYKKRKEFAPRYRTILKLARDKKKLARLPTKTSPKIDARGLKVNVSFHPLAQNAIPITIDDVDSFSKVRKYSSNRLIPLPEQKIKDAFKKIIGERGSFKDWAGEKSDLYTTKIRFHGRRVAVAIAFKGKGTEGKLVPAKMGKNGDQIGKLFDEPAQLFLVVYGGQIDSSIIYQMQAFAIGKAIGGRKIYFGVVDGDDLGRLVSAYPRFF